MKKTLTIVSSILLGLAAVVSAGAQTATKLTASRQIGKGISARAATRPLKRPTVQTVSKSVLADGLSSGLGKAFVGNPTIKPELRKAPRYATPENLPEMFGCVTYQNSADFTAGYYKISSSGTTQIFGGPVANYGAVVVDNTLYTFDYPSFGGFYWIQIDAWDLESGEKLVSNQFGEMTNLCPGGAVQDPTTGKIYALTFNTGGDGYWFSQLDINSEAQVDTRRIAALQGNWNSIVCDAAGQIYAISYTAQGSGQNMVVTSSTLCKLDKQTGAVTTIGETGEAPQYMSSAAIDPNSGRMFWNVNPSDGTS